LFKKFIVHVFVLKEAKLCFCLGVVFKVNKCKFGYIVFSLFECICINLQGSLYSPLWMSSSMFSQILVGTQKNFVIDLANFSTQTEKGCPPLT